MLKKVKMKPQWSPAELAFHLSSQGRVVGRERVRYRDQCPKVLARKVLERGWCTPIQVFRLPRDARTRASRSSLAKIIRTRKTRYAARRDFTLRELASYLAEMMAPGPKRFNGLDDRKRNYPSGGSLYESLVFLLIQRVSGLPPGLYYYDERARALELLRPMKEIPADLIVYPCIASRKRAFRPPPQAQVFIIADFQRLLWAYRAISYRTALSNASILMYHGLLLAECHGFSAFPMGLYPSEHLAALLCTKEQDYPLMTQYCLVGKR